METKTVSLNSHDGFRVRKSDNGYVFVEGISKIPQIIERATSKKINDAARRRGLIRSDRELFMGF